MSAVCLMVHVVVYILRIICNLCVLLEFTRKYSDVYNLNKLKKKKNEGTS